MKKVFILLFAAVMMTCSVSKAYAITIGFDDIGTAGGSISAGYYGFNWNNMNYINSSDNTVMHSGFHYGTISGNYVGVNPYSPDGIAAVIYKSDNLNFTFNSAYLTSAWENTDTVTIKGWSGPTDTPIYTKTVNVIGQLAYGYVFDFENINILTIQSTNGPIAIDNITFNENVGSVSILAAYDPATAVIPAENVISMGVPIGGGAPTPEPSSMVLGLLSIGSLFGIRRRKK